MISTELLNTLRALDRAEKLHVLQVLVSELAQEEAHLLSAYPNNPEALKAISAQAKWRKAR